MIIITGTVEIGIKKDPSNLKPQGLIMFKLYLNHAWPLFSQTEDAIIINTIFVIFIIFFILFFLFIILFINKEKPPGKNNPSNNDSNGG